MSQTNVKTNKAVISEQKQQHSQAGRDGTGLDHSLGRSVRGCGHPQLIFFLQKYCSSTLYSVIITTAKAMEIMLKLLFTAVWH